MNLISSTRTASAALLMAAAALIASPASAQRGIDLDNDFDVPLNVCTLGVQCDGYSLESPSANLAFYGSAVIGLATVEYFNVQKIFIYNEGVVSFDSQLPIGFSPASVGGGLESLGRGDWFGFD